MVTTSQREESDRLASKISAASKDAGGEKKALQQIEERELELLEAQENARDQDLKLFTYRLRARHPPTIGTKGRPRFDFK